MMDMIDLAPTPATKALESVTSITDQFPTVSNVGICVDSLCTTGRAGINFCCCPSPLGKICFGASIACGLVGAAASTTALISSSAGVPMAGWVGSCGARGCNRLGKYALRMGNVTSGNITDVGQISDLMN